jgi:starvation-inducible DNA-binding protein
MAKIDDDVFLKKRAALKASMNNRLASVIDLQLQMKQAHWNVNSPSFIGLNQLFCRVDDAVENYGNMIAKRIVQLGGIAEGNVRVTANRTQLPEYPQVLSEGMAHVAAVSNALSSFDHETRTTIDEANDLDDADTADLFTEVSLGIDKWLWFVEAHSQPVTQKNYSYYS